MKKLTPQIDFSHVLKEISVNRNDPCEIIRELISNAYDAKAKNIWYAPLKEIDGFIFFDDGEGLSMCETNGISSYESFFSIGKSTKLKGNESIGYKCQGAKLCFASGAVTVITKTAEEQSWRVTSIDDPRSKLNTNMDITPRSSPMPWAELSTLFPAPDQDTVDTLNLFSEDFFAENFISGTLIIVQRLDVEDYINFFLCEEGKNSYLVNYIRFSTRHGSVKRITAAQGFGVQALKQISPESYFATFYIRVNNGWETIDPGYPYLPTLDIDESDKKPNSPLHINSLKDGHFYSRNARSFKIGGAKYSVILAVDGNRRALKGYSELDRKGGTRSGMRLTDQRGVFLAVNGVKICPCPDILSRMEGRYSALVGSSNAKSHYLLIIDGPFDLITSRNGISSKASKILNSPDFTSKLKLALDNFSKDEVFGGLVDRLNKEVTNQSIDGQITKLEKTKKSIEKRERFTINFSETDREVFLSPLPGEEYLVGVLYASLAMYAEKNKELWKKVLTFSTQGIDSIGLNQMTRELFDEKNLVSIEYKYQLDNKNLFNHMLATVNYIVAWEVNLEDKARIEDTYKCSGIVNQVSDGVWEISDVESTVGEYYGGKITVISLKDLIRNTFKTTWTTWKSSN